MKWCPFAGCNRAISRPEMPAPPQLSIPHMKPPLETSQAVDCGNGHYFCWECSGDAHEPCSCDKWNEWHQRITDVKPEESKSSDHGDPVQTSCTRCSQAVFSMTRDMLLSCTNGCVLDPSVLFLSSSHALSRRCFFVCLILV